MPTTRNGQCEQSLQREQTGRDAFRIVNNLTIRTENNAERQVPSDFLFLAHRVEITVSSCSGVRSDSFRQPEFFENIKVQHAPHLPVHDSKFFLVSILQIDPEPYPHFVATPHDVFKTRSLRRHPPSAQIHKALLESLKATPWDPRGSCEETDNFVFPPVGAHLA